MLVHDEAQRSIGYLPPKISRILTENLLSDPATPRVGDVDVRRIRDIAELFMTAASESFPHEEWRKFRAGGRDYPHERQPGFRVTIDFEQNGFYS
jgi:hypothetical protein